MGAGEHLLPALPPGTEELRMATYNRCPGCDREPTGGLLGGVYVNFYRCRHCSRLYCYKCGGITNTKCPVCQSKRYEKVGKYWKV